MAAVILAHFSHPEHELVKRHYVGPFITCDMCCEGLSGPAYGCRAGCNFDIHDSCAGHPRTLLSPTHHPHQLELTQIGRDVTAFACDVCAGRCPPGCFLYRCLPCGFDMHPRCARLPPVVRRRSSWHPEHDLTLVQAEGRCAASACPYGGTWFYRCSACSLDLHVSCSAADGRARHDENGHCPPDAADGVRLHDDENGHCYKDAADGVGIDDIIECELVRARISNQMAMTNALAQTIASFNISGLID